MTVRIVAIRSVSIDFPVTRATSKPRRPAATESNLRIHPINKYPEFSRGREKVPGAIPSDFWVQVIADDGTFGIAPGSWGKPTEFLVEELFAPLLVGRDCLATELSSDIMWRASQRQGPDGLVSVARSAIDLALWDLKGKLLGQPVYTLLGGPVREKIPLYCTTDDLDWGLELGFDQFKISNPAHYDDGIAGLNAIEEAVSKARETIGPARELMLNPVMSFNVEYTLRVAECLRPYRLRWLEEPLMPGDPAGYEELKRAITWLPLATGEDHYGRHSFRQLLERRAIDVIQPDIRWCGGLTELVKIYNLAEAFGVITVPHFAANNPYGQHFAFAMPESPVAEYFINSAPGVPLEEARKVPGVAVPTDGYLVPSDAPGFGVEVAEEWIRPL
jgi:L-rhamnonate dehydratase